MGFYLFHHVVAATATVYAQFAERLPSPRGFRLAHSRPVPDDECNPSAPHAHRKRVGMTCAPPARARRRSLTHRESAEKIVGKSWFAILPLLAVGAGTYALTDAGGKFARRRVCLAVSLRRAIFLASNILSFHFRCCRGDFIDCCVAKKIPRVPRCAFIMTAAAASEPTRAGSKRCRCRGSMSS